MNVLTLACTVGLATTMATFPVAAQSSLPSRPAQAAGQKQAPTSQQNAATQVFHALLDAEWDYTMLQNPTWASTLGDRRWNDKWEDSSLQNIHAQFEHSKKVLGALNMISRAQLSPADQLNYDLFKQDFDLDVEAFQYGAYLAPVNQRGGLQSADELADLLRFQTVKDYQDWITRLRTFNVPTEQTIALMREGIRRKVLHPKIIMQRIPAQIEKQIVDDPTKSGFYRPFTKFPADISEADRARLQQEAQQAIRDVVVPSFRKFHEFFVKEYLPASFDQVGVWQRPNGDAYYAFAAKRFTTTQMTPEQIHEIGQREVKRIREQMEQIKQKVGYTGTLAEFFNYLRTDPRFFYKTGEEILESSRAVAKRIDPELVKVFGKLPRTPYGVIPIPMNIAPDTTTAYYNSPAADGSRAGMYYVNLYKPEMRPKWEQMALTLHEAVPGHHLQIALAQELGELPKFRRYGGYTAFTEGWGLYAESLGEDMGLYDDPYSKFGQLAYEMWRAVRLVVDTGMHSKHWTRDQAIKFFMDNAPKAELDVVNEIDRYIAWPGQALAYKIGELKLKELRARAKQQLGETFDVREFHDAVLGQGAIPLNILERNVDAWVAKKKAATAD